MKRFATLGIVVCVASLCLLTGVFAQAGKFQVQFDDTSLSSVLDTFKRFDPNFQFSLAPELGDTKITASLVDVTVDEALTIVLGQAGLMSVKDAGVYQIRPKPDAKGPRVERPALRLPPPVFINRPAAPGEGAGGAAGAAAAPGAAAGAAAATENPPLRLIMVRFADPGDMAYLFGGTVEYGSSGGGNSGGGSGGSGGGYGGSSGGGSSRGGGGGSSRGGSGGSSRGGSGGSGGSSRGSSGGSSRGSSGGSSRGGSY